MGLGFGRTELFHRTCLHALVLKYMTAFSSWQPRWKNIFPQDWLLFSFAILEKNSPGVHSLHIWGLELNPLMMHFAGWKIIKTPSWPFAAAYFARWRLQAMTHCRVQRSRCSNRSGCSINQDTHNAEHAWIPERQKWDVDAKVWSCESVWACQANSLLSLLHRA